MPFSVPESGVLLELSTPREFVLQSQFIYTPSPPIRLHRVQLDVQLNAPIVVPAKETTDLASVPPILWGLIASYGRHTLPALMHDHLCDIADEKSESGENWSHWRARADEAFHSALRDPEGGFGLTSPPWRAVMLWAGVAVGRQFKTARWQGIGIVLASVLGWAALCILTPWVRGMLRPLTAWLGTYWWVPASIGVVFLLFTLSAISRRVPRSRSKPWFLPSLAVVGVFLIGFWPLPWDDPTIGSAYDVHVPIWLALLTASATILVILGWRLAKRAKSIPPTLGSTGLARVQLVGLAGTVLLLLTLNDLLPTPAVKFGAAQVAAIVFIIFIAVYCAILTGGPVTRDGWLPLIGMLGLITVLPVALVTVAALFLNWIPDMLMDEEARAPLHNYGNKQASTATIAGLTSPFAYLTNPGGGITHRVDLGAVPAIHLGSLPVASDRQWWLGMDESDQIKVYRLSRNQEKRPGNAGWC
jgi:hypothetical protein